MREKESERNIKVWLSLTRPLLGTWPATQACVLTGNRTQACEPDCKQPCGSQACTQFTELHQPGLFYQF